MRKTIFFIVVCLILSVPAQGMCVSSSTADDTWAAMIDGIRRYSSDTKLREEFDILCNEKDIAFIDGRIDTGGGLYMIMDAPVYKQPGGSKKTELPHETKVVLTGQSQNFQGDRWLEIEFLFISDYSKTAVSIDKAWVKEAGLIPSL
jgi:hypothetical protein